MRHDFEENQKAPVVEPEHANKELRVQSGEGYYQALHRFMPELSNRELVKLATEVRKYNHGKDVLRAGDCLQLPPLEIGDGKPPAIAKHEANVSVHTKQSESNSVEQRKPIIIDARERPTDKVAPLKNPTDDRNAALMELIGTATSAVKARIEDHTVKPLGKLGKEVEKNIDGTLKSTGEAIGKAVDQTGKWAKRTGDDAVKIATAAEKAAEQKAGQVLHAVAEQLKPDENTVAAMKKLEEAQRRVEQERDERNRRHLIDGSISIAKALHNVQRSINECGNFLSTVTSAVKDNLRI